MIHGMLEEGEQGTPRQEQGDGGGRVPSYEGTEGVMKGDVKSGEGIDLCLDRGERHESYFLVCQFLVTVLQFCQVSTPMPRIKKRAT